MGRPKKFDTNEVLDSAMRVFWNNGFHPTSYEDLMDATGLNKQSIYHSFGDKKSLFIQTLELSVARSLEYISLALNKSKSPIKNLMDLCYFMTKTDLDIAPRSCFVVKCTMEFGQDDPDILRIIDNCYEEHEKLFSSAVAAGQKLGEITTTLSSTDIAKSLLNTWSGIRVMQQRGVKQKELKSVFETSFKLLKVASS